MNKFIFEDCFLDKKTGQITATYKLLTDNKEYFFQEKIKFHKKVAVDLSDSIINEILKLVHFTLGISYWKSYCYPIEVKKYFLDQEQAKFFTTVYTKGLGEFFFKNNIDFRGLINFPFSKKILKKKNIIESKFSQYLLGVGGGKDSIVSAEILKEKNIPFNVFIVETNKDYKLIDEVSRLINVSVFKVQREIDIENLTKLENSYDGHIPISLVYAVLAITASVLYGYKGFLTSNEKSANYGNITYLDHEINHQWSKTSEFENIFRDYIHNYIGQHLGFKSLLREYSEFEIVEKFIKYEKYFRVFSSCNLNFSVSKQISTKNSKWCGRCPKCAFVFLMLSAFLDEQTVISIFDKNLFDDQSLLQTFKELAGISGFKPFECVGTKEEVLLAFQKIRKSNKFADSYILKNLPV